MGGVPYPPVAATLKILAAEFALSRHPRPSPAQAKITNTSATRSAGSATTSSWSTRSTTSPSIPANGAGASDRLKYLAERINATFVYAGIDIETQGQFSGTRGR
jgi:hypothetical protein